MLPVAGGIAAPENISSTSKLMTSAHDCCDHVGMPNDYLMKDCQAAAGCASKCFSLFGMVFPRPMIHPAVSGVEVSFASKPFRSQAGSPPFRPPRV
jgi:hypothetical protein